MELHEISLPDAKLHLAELASPFANSQIKVHFEIRALKFISKQTQSASFRFNPLSKLSVEQALKFSAQHNATGWNIYVTPNPLVRSGSISTPAKDTDVLFASHIFLDADEKNTAQELLQSIRVDYDFIVVTGTKPHLRLHMYIQLQEPMEDLRMWKYLLKRMIAIHDCDPAASNAARIMRLAGFINYPPDHKCLKGYTTELVKFYAKDEYHDFL